MGAMGAQCDYTAYPAKPTFCDNWCRVLLRANCGQEPENCVRACEYSKGPAECRRFHEELLGCYESAPPSAFACSGNGFQRSARPEESVCQAERDALIRCAYPEVTECLGVCRAAENIYAASATDAGAPSERICPSYDVPCDSICWTAYFGLPPDPDPDSNPDATPANGGAPQTLTDAGVARPTREQLVSCALETALACHSEPSADVDASAPDASTTGNANWASVLLDCEAKLGF
jgi:hypothetical protein